MLSLPESGRILAASDGSTPVCSCSVVETLPCLVPIVRTLCVLPVPLALLASSPYRFCIRDGDRPALSDRRNTPSVPVPDDSPDTLSLRVDCTVTRTASGSQK